MGVAMGTMTLLSVLDVITHSVALIVTNWVTSDFAMVELIQNVAVTPIQYVFPWLQRYYLVATLIAFVTMHHLSW